MIDYDRMSSKELRELFFSEGLKHENMSEFDYECFLDNEIQLKNPDNSVLEFCLAGLRDHDKFRDCDDITIYTAFLEKIRKWKSYELPPELDDGLTFHEEIRNKILSGDPAEIGEEYMNEGFYEFLLSLEGRLERPDDTVMQFCFNGLKKYDKYKNSDDVMIYADVILKNDKSKIVVHERDRQPKPRIRLRKAVTVALIAVVSTMLVAMVTAELLGYSVVQLGRDLLNISDGVAKERDDNEIIRTDGVRVYNSFAEMLETENLNILFPARLPTGYEFTNFEVVDSGVEFVVLAYSAEPYIKFEVFIEAGFNIGSFDYEINGTRYNILEIDVGVYQAEWSDGENYYVLVIKDRDVLSEIIENLQERQ